MQIRGRFETAATISDFERADFTASEVTLFIYPEWVTDRLPYELTAPPKEYEDLEKDERRVAPLWIVERFVAELQYRIVPPPGFVAKQLPENKRYVLASDMVLTQTVKTTESGTIHIDFKLHTGEGRLSPDDVVAVREVLHALHEADGLSDWYFEITFKETGAQLLEDGKVAEAVSEYRRLIENDPKDAIQYARLAQALMQAGLGDLAVMNARKAAEIEPKNGAVHRILGTVLMSDSYGRYLQHGFDIAGAEEALRKCVELNKDDFKARWQLAILLEHNAEGYRYSDPERLQEAIEIYKETIEETDHDDIKRNLTFAMLYNGDYKALSKLLRKWDRTDQRQALQAALLAISDGAPTASEFIGRAADSRELRASYYEIAGTHLNRLKYYKEAAELTELTPGQSAVAKRSIEVLRKLESLNDAPVSPSEPEYAVQQFFRQAISYGPYSEQALSSFDQFDLFKDRLVIQQLPSVVGSVFRLAVESDTPLPRALDAVGLIPLTVESDGDDAYRVTAEYPAGRKSAWYVIRDGEAFRLFNPGLGDRRIGEKVLELINDGKSDAARKWLKWSFQYQKKNLRWFNELSGSPFARVWFLGKHDEELTLRMSAAMLMGPSDRPDEAIDVLLETKKQLAEDDVRRFQVDRALADVYTYHHRSADAEIKIKDLLAKHPNDGALLTQLIRVLVESDKAKEAIDLAEKATASRKVGDPLRFSYGWALVEDGQIAIASSEFEKLSERSLFKASAANSIAWNSLFVEFSESDQRIASKAFQTLRRTADGSSGGDVSAILHTLAYLHADRGEVVQARDVLYRSIVLRGYGPIYYDFLILGRIAEQCGFPDEAAKFYNRVLAHEQDDAGELYSAAMLAKRRLKVLGSH